MKRIKLSRGEEIANAITHGFGAVLSIAALILLIVTSVKNGKGIDITGAVIFGASVFFLYIMSTLCHAFGLKEGKTRKMFRILDHSAIYVLIAGTYTPFCLSAIGGTQGYILLGVQWTLAIIGVVFRAVYYDRFTPVHVAIYIAMGWMVAFFVKSLSVSIPQTGIVLLISGGIFYTVGVIFYAIRMFKYHHMVWHICVILGTACHFFLIYLYILSGV